MTDRALNSAASADVRSVGSLLAVLTPMIVLLAIGDWAGLTHDALRYPGADAIHPLADASGQAQALTWEQLKGCPLDRRDDFTAGVRRLVLQLEDRRAAVGGRTPSAAFQESLGRMRAELESLRLASNRTWESAKLEVGEAWRRLQQAAGPLPE